MKQRNRWGEKNEEEGKVLRALKPISDTHK